MQQHNKYYRQRLYACEFPVHDLKAEYYGPVAEKLQTYQCHEIKWATFVWCNSFCIMLRYCLLV